jgi:hypothetical protein
MPWHGATTGIFSIISDINDRSPMNIIALITSGLLATAAASSAFAHSVVYEAELLGANEVPAVNTPGKGKATVTLDEHAMTLRVQASFADLQGGVTSAHIHCCTAQPDSGTAGVATTLPTFAGFPVGVTSGSYDRTFDLSLATNWNNAFINTHGGNVESAFQALSLGLADEKAYFNLHSSSFPGGEIRGTLTSAVPEPATLALMLTGLGCLAAARGRAHRVQA